MKATPRILSILSIHVSTPLSHNIKIHARRPVPHRSRAPAIAILTAYPRGELHRSGPSEFPPCGTET